MNIQVDDIVRISLTPERRGNLARAGEMGRMLIDSDGCECQVAGIKQAQYEDDRMRTFSLHRRDGVRIICSSVDFMFLRHGQRQSAVVPDVFPQAQQERAQMELFDVE